MTKTYESVLKQIDDLKAQAEQLRRKEIEGVVGRIREAIRVYGLTAGDLGLGPGRRRKFGAPGKPATNSAPAAKKTRRARKGRKPRSSLAIKYRNDQGQTWVGIGKRPQWLRDALAAGKSLADFSVK